MNLLNPYESAFPKWLFWSGIIHTIVEYRKGLKHATQIQHDFFVHIATKPGFSIYYLEIDYRRHKKAASCETASF